MKKSTRNSLLFGLAVGGLFTALRKAGEKTKLTDGQLRDINSLKDTFTRLEQALAEHIELAPVHVFLREKQETKSYQDIEMFLGSEIQTNRTCIGMCTDLESRLKYVLSGRFTADRANAKTHEVQSFFLSFKRFPEVVELLLEKRIEILTKMKRAYAYIEAGESADFKPEDARELHSLVSEFSILSKDVSNQFQRLP